VTKGSGLPGAYQVARAEWIEVTEIRSSAATPNGIEQTGLGAGEVSTVILAKEISAELILMDELKGRRFARASGFEVLGCVGILEILYRRAEISDLRDATHSFLPIKSGSILRPCSEAWINLAFHGYRFREFREMPGE
jgi:predicted nucleic acid-binding protein